MSRTFLTLVDESGCEGTANKPGSHEFLILSAVTIRYSNIQFLTEIWHRASMFAKKSNKWQWPSFKDMGNAKEKYLISCLISELPIRFCTVICHNPSLEKLREGANHGDLYFFLSQLLLERISWVCRDSTTVEGDKKTRIIFSQRGSLRVDRFLESANALASGKGKYPSNTYWGAIDLNDVFAKPHKECEGLKIADFIASSFGAACEHKMYGITDDRYVIPMCRLVYRYKLKAMGNGLKFFPPQSDLPLLKEDRFRWATTHYK